MTQNIWDLIFYLGIHRIYLFLISLGILKGLSILGDKKSDGPSIWRETPAGSQPLDCEKSRIRKPLEV